MSPASVIATPVSPSVLGYDAYVYQLHCARFPNDHSDAMRAYDASPVDIESEVARISNRSEQELRQVIFQQLRFTSALAQRELMLPTNRSQIVESKQALSTLSERLINVGSMVMTTLFEDPLYAKDDRLFQLTNPFEDKDILIGIVQNQVDKRRPLNKSKLFTLNRLAPGYF